MPIPDIASLFADSTDQYDQFRKKVIPNFDLFYSAVLEGLTFSPDQKLKIADLGAGTGLLSYYLFKQFPKAELDLIDLTSKMLEQAKRKFKNANNINYLIMDYTTHGLNSGYDLIVSAMSIHHLSDPFKFHLFKHIHEQLLPGGMFINADLVKGPTKFMEKIYQEKWLSYIMSSGLQIKEINKIKQRMKLDQPAYLSDQLNWLLEIGFINVDCLYKYFNFAVLAGQKP